MKYYYYSLFVYRMSDSERKMKKLYGSVRGLRKTGKKEGK